MIEALTLRVTKDVMEMDDGSGPDTHSMQEPVMSGTLDLHTKEENYVVVL